MAEHSGSPRDLAYLEQAFTDGQNSLAIFARMGHHFHLAPGPGEKHGDWPRMMFHATSAPNGRMVFSEFDLYDLGDGWCDTLEDAQVRDGTIAGFAGRGGVSRRALPVVVEPSAERNPEAQASANKITKEAFIASQHKEP